MPVEKELNKEIARWEVSLELDRIAHGESRWYKNVKKRLKEDPEGFYNMIKVQEAFDTLQKEEPQKFLKFLQEVFPND